MKSVLFFSILLIFAPGFIYGEEEEVRCELSLQHGCGPIKTNYDKAITGITTFSNQTGSAQSLRRPNSNDDGTVWCPASSGSYVACAKYVFEGPEVNGCHTKITFKDCVSYKDGKQEMQCFKETLSEIENMGIFPINGPHVSWNIKNMVLPNSRGEICLCDSDECNSGSACFSIYLVFPLFTFAILFTV